MSNSTDIMLLERCAKGAVSFTHAIDLAGGRTPKLVRSTVSPSRQKELHALALDGYLAEAVTGCGGHGTPPETVVTYTLTAKGRMRLGLHAELKRPVNRQQSLTDEQLEREGIA